MQYSSHDGILGRRSNGVDEHICEVSGVGFGCPNWGGCWKLRILGALERHIAYVPIFVEIKKGGVNYSLKVNLHTGKAVCSVACLE